MKKFVMIILVLLTCNLVSYANQLTREEIDLLDVTLRNLIYERDFYRNLSDNQSHTIDNLKKDIEQIKKSAIVTESTLGSIDTMTDTSLDKLNQISILNDTLKKECSKYERKLKIWKTATGVSITVGGIAVVTTILYYKFNK